MPFECSHQDRTILFRIHGELTRGDISDILRQVEALEDSGHVFTEQIIDARAVTSYQISFNDIFAFARRRREKVRQHRIKSALIINSPAGTGFSRMLQTLNTNPQVEIKTFADDQAAREWLDQPSE